jgi:hypothetical protein
VGERQAEEQSYTNHSMCIVYISQHTKTLSDLWALSIAETVTLETLCLFSRDLLAALASLAYLDPLGFLEWKVTG